ncbi:MADS-box transcription factor family protein [Rhynchospora pubera]|uniref:MADS-box transcription factor family protein n=1 Tax=Rhynchospora pubera TaxID=906938 RepID=A0AAV8EE16_9POAL|nr:MADS-box transcription factor family protein [Rhynchospora pubera]
MGRKKATMELIGKMSVRSSTFRKRKASLLKKANELAILCDVEVSVVVAAGPDDPEPEIWPSLEKAANMVSYANGYTSNKKEEQTKKVVQQVADMQVELKKLEMENLEMEAKLFLEELLSGRSQVANVASPEIAMRLWAMIDNRRMAVHQRINTLLSLPVPFHSAAPCVPVLSDVQEETPWLFSHLTADMTNTSELQIDGGPPLECWPEEVDAGAENNANLPAQGPATSADQEDGQLGLSEQPTETGEFFSTNLPAETTHSEEVRGAVSMCIGDGPPIECWTMEDVIGGDLVNAIPSEHTPFPSVVPDIGQPVLIDLPDETTEAPAVIAYTSELYGADGMQVEDEASHFYCPVYDDISERIDVILSSFSRF